MCHKRTLREHLNEFLKWRDKPVFLPLTARQKGAILTFVDYIEHYEGKENK